mgnify:CR=1 FL=1
MVSRILRILLMVALTGCSVWQFWVSNIGNGIFLILLALIVLFTYFKNEWMIMALLAMRKNEVEKAERRLLRIKDPDHALVRRERASYYFLLGAIRSQRNLTESERLFKKALEIGLSRQEKAMAKLQLGAIAEFEKFMGAAVDAGQTLTADMLCAEYARLCKLYYGEDMVVDDQIAMVKQGLKRTPGQPGYFQQQQLVRGGRHR